MGMVKADITLKNVADEALAERGYIEATEIRTMEVRAVVDTGAATLIINEEQCQILGLGIREERSLKMANGSRVTCKITKPVEICWKDRHWSCEAVVVSGAESVLLGAIPLEGMDLMINPKTQELVGVHGDIVEYMAY